MTSRLVLTLTLVRCNGKILLGYKKRGFGCGKWNGFGGKIENGETVHQAAIRELEEESGLKVEKLNNVGLLEFEFEGDPQILEVHVYSTSEYQGDPVETEEMRPKWFSLEDIPFEKMWADDKYWFPLFLQNKKFHGYFLYKNNETIINYKLHEVEQLPPNTANSV